MKTTLSLICSFCLLVLNTYGQEEINPLLSKHYRHHHEMPGSLTVPNDTNDPHNLKIGDSDVPISTHDGQYPTEEQLNTIQNALVDDFLVNDDIGVGIKQYFPSIAIDDYGNFVIVWEDYRAGSPDIYYQCYNSSGKAQDLNKKVNKNDAGNVDQLEPSISIDYGGNFVIAWMDKRNGNYDIYYQRYNSSGTAIGVNTKANDDAGTARQYSPSISMDDCGNFVIVWQDKRNGNYSDIYFQRYDSNGLTLGVNSRANDDAGRASWYPSISMDSQGNFAIMWSTRSYEEYGNIYFQRFSFNGETQGINTSVNVVNNDVYYWYPSMTMDAVGNFVIAWENRNSDIFYQRFNTYGVPQGENSKANDDTVHSIQFFPTISSDSQGNFVIAWEDYRNGNYDIYYQRYDSIGIRLGINSKANDDIGTAFQWYSSISMDSHGNFIIA